MQQDVFSSSQLLLISQFLLDISKGLYLAVVVAKFENLAIVTVSGQLVQFATISISFITAISLMVVKGKDVRYPRPN